ncbi:MAG: hypothetical protein ACO38P_06120, partial [Phycisphaerales bacterium]
MPSPSAKARRSNPQATASNASRRRSELAWLKEVTAIPTAAGREQRVIEWIERWVKARRHLAIDRDAAGNLFIRPKAALRSKKSAPAPILVTAHLDHPAFVVLSEPRRGVLGELGFELDVASTSVAAAPAATKAGRRRGGPH